MPAVGTGAVVTGGRPDAEFHEDQFQAVTASAFTTRKAKSTRFWGIALQGCGGRSCVLYSCRLPEPSLRTEGKASPLPLETVD